MVGYVCSEIKILSGSLTCSWIGLNKMMTKFLVICSQGMMLMN
jgi:hypothetical protein